MSLQQRLCYVLFCAKIVILCKTTNEYGHKLLEQGFNSAYFVRSYIAKQGTKMTFLEKNGWKRLNEICLKGRRSSDSNSNPWGQCRAW